jgi:hypothetical protein
MSSSEVGRTCSVAGGRLSPTSTSFSRTIGDMLQVQTEKDGNAGLEDSKDASNGAGKSDILAQ